MNDVCFTARRSNACDWLSAQALVDQTKAKIFVIDDDESVRVSLGRLLRTAGMQSRAFESAQQFLCFLQSNSNGHRLVAGDCAIVDVHMPAMTGIELMRRLNKSYPALRVVLITASLDPEAKTVAETAGVVLLQKPFDDTALFAAISPPLARDAEVGLDQKAI